MYNPFSLEGKTILVTGASSGIGRTTAIECSKLGAHVVITGRNAERLQETFNLLEGSGHMQILADLTDTESLEHLVKEMPQLDGLVNNAGIGYNRPVTFIKSSDLDAMFGTNTYAPVMLTKLAMKKKKINKGGSVVFTSSIAALIENMGNAVYSMSKAAIMSFAKTCALEFADKGIRVNSVHPGMVETKLIHGGAISEDDMQKDIQNYPLKRYGRPEEIAWSIIYLLSDASAWVTGSQSVIDGGMHLK